MLKHQLPFNHCSRLSSVEPSQYLEWGTLRHKTISTWSSQLKLQKLATEYKAAMASIIESCGLPYFSVESTALKQKYI